jgi:hypothetical protein
LMATAFLLNRKDGDIADGADKRDADFLEDGPVREAVVGKSSLSGWATLSFRRGLPPGGRRAEFLDESLGG